MQPSEIYSNEEHRVGDGTSIEEIDAMLDKIKEESPDHAIQVGWGIGKNEEGELTGVVNLVVDNVPIEMASSRAYELGMILISTGEIANTMACVTNVLNGIEDLNTDLTIKNILKLLEPK